MTVPSTPQPRFQPTPNLPDLRSLIPPGVPPPPEPLPYRHDDAQQRAFDQVTQVRTRMLTDSRKAPLPPYMWVMQTYDRPILLRVLAPRVVEICRGIDHQPEVLQVARVLRAGIRGAHFRLEDLTGTRHRMSVPNPGELGAADVAVYPKVGATSDPTEPLLVGLWTELRDAVLGFLTIPMLIAMAIWRTPEGIARARRRRHVRNRVVALIQG